ncbi:uncharacterized protein DS421_3g81030 [Arachis hypogaea]|nr:uncharacterized protein DS421_3g81030 [Arachis hypogaea]
MMQNSTMTTWFVPPSILGFNSIRNGLDWVQNALEIAGHELPLVSHVQLPMRTSDAHVRVSKRQATMTNFISFEAPDVSFPTQLEPPHLDLCISGYDQLNAKSSGLTALRFLHIFMSSPTFHAFPSFLQSNLCLLNLKSLNKHIKASNGIKVN